MFHDTELELKAAGRNDFLPFMAMTSLLACFAAILSTNPVLLISVNCVCFFFSYHCFGHSNGRLETSGRHIKTNADGDLLVEQTSVPAVFGKLAGSQWCSRYMAVLQYKAAGRIGHLVILKVQQHPEQFRQLSVWLRHNSRNEGRLES